MAAFDAFIVTPLLFAVCWIASRLLLSSARTRLRRARDSASTLTDDVTLLVRQEKTEQAAQVADSHGTVIGWAMSRALASAPVDRATCIQGLDASWRARLAGVPLAYYEPLSFLPILPGLIGAYVTAVAVFVEGRGTIVSQFCIVMAVSVASALCTWPITRCAVRIHAERQSLGDHYRACLAEFARALDGPREGRESPPGVDPDRS